MSNGNRHFLPRQRRFMLADSSHVYESLGIATIIFWTSDSCTSCTRLRSPFKVVAARWVEAAYVSLSLSNASLFVPRPYHFYRLCTSFRTDSRPWSCDVSIAYKSKVRICIYTAKKLKIICNWLYPKNFEMFVFFLSKQKYAISQKICIYMWFLSSIKTNEIQYDKLNCFIAYIS